MRAQGFLQSRAQAGCAGGRTGGAEPRQEVPQKIVGEPDAPMALTLNVHNLRIGRTELFAKSTCLCR